jgi:hypothetical protein
LEWTHSFWMQIGRLRCPSSCPRGPRQQNHRSLKCSYIEQSTCKAKVEWEKCP